MQMHDFHDLFVHKVQDLYSAENQIVEALPKVIESVSDQKLADGLAEHLAETKHQVERLESIAESLGFDPKGKECSGMKGILKEGEDLMKADLDPAVMDAGLLAACQVVEHYEIANYGAAVEWAELMGHDDEAKLLKETLDEEEKADEKLSKVSEDVNEEANTQAGMSDDSE